MDMDALQAAGNTDAEAAGEEDQENVPMPPADQADEEVDAQPEAP